MRFSLWLDALTRPEETFKKEKANASLGEAILNVGVAGLISGILFAVFGFLFVTLLFSSLMLSSGLMSGSILGFAIIFLIFIIVVPIFCIVGLFIYSLILFAVARALGGKGDFTAQTYLFSLFMAPLGIIHILGMIPIIGLLISFVVNIYSLYLTVIALRETHSFSTGKAILTILIPAVLAIIAVILFVVIFMAAIIGSR